MTASTPAPEQIRAAWDTLATGFDDFVSPRTITSGETLIADLGVRQGTRFLDVAAGTGALAIPAARRGASVVAVDIAPTMIDRLRARATAEALSNLDARVMSGEELDLPDDSVDVAASLNGVSLLPDFDRGLAELVRVTAPGGRVVIASFGPLPQAEFVSFFMSAMRTAIPDFTPLPTNPPPLPFQVADPETMRTKLLHRGLTDVSVLTPTWEWHFPSADAYWSAVTASNPIAARLVVDLTATQRDDVVRVLDGMFRERSGGDPGADLRNVMTIGIGTK